MKPCIESVQGLFLHDKFVLLSWTYQCTQYVLCVRPFQALYGPCDYRSMYVLWLVAPNNRQCQHQQYDKQHSPLQCCINAFFCRSPRISFAAEAALGGPKNLSVGELLHRCIFTHCSTKCTIHFYMVLNTTDCLALTSAYDCV